MSVVTQVAGPAALVILDWPEKRNALGPEQAGELAAALRTAAADPNVRGVVITGNGAFCAGGDIKGMVARAEMLGDTGANHPDNWVGGLASPSLHAIVILFAGDEAERERCVTEHNKFIAQCSDVEVLSSLDLAAIPHFNDPFERHLVEWKTLVAELGDRVSLHRRQNGVDRLGIHGHRHGANHGVVVKHV